MKDEQYDRRSVLRGGIGLAAAAAVGGPMLAGCDRSSVGSNSQAKNNKVTLPAYRPYKGVKPDLPGDAAGVADAFFGYPKSPVRAIHDRPGDGSTIHGMVESTAPIPPTAGRNKYWSELNKRIGAEVKLDITPASDFKDKFQTVLAGGELPDMAEIPGGLVELPRLLASKAHDLTEFLSGKAIKDYPFLANLPPNTWRQCVFNGGIYAIPVPRGASSTLVLYLRDDLVRSDGIDPGKDLRIDSFDDLFAFAQQINDPKHNRWAMATAPLDSIRMMLGIPNGWRNDGGTLTSSWVVPEQKEALSAARKLVQAGLIHPDSFSDSVHEQQKIWFNAGQAVMVSGTYAGLRDYYQQNIANPDFAVSIMDLPGFRGGKARPWLGNPAHNITAFKKTTKQRIAMLLAVANWMAAPFGTEEYLFRHFGIRDHDYQIEDGEPVLTQTGNSETQLSQFAIEYLADCPQVLYYPGQPDLARHEYEHMKRLVPNGIANPAVGLYSETQSRKGLELTTKVSDTETAILQGRKPVSAWDDAIKEWRADGGDQIRDELEEALAAGPVN